MSIKKWNIKMIINMLFLEKFMMKIKLLYDQSRFIEQENTISLSSDLNKLGKFNIHLFTN